MIAKGIEKDIEIVRPRGRSIAPRVSGFRGTPALVRPPASALIRSRDQSCYVRIENRGTRPLRLVRYATSAISSWAVPPPKEIQPRSVADIHVRPAAGVARGSAGSFSYSDGYRTYDFSLKCAVKSSNSIISPVPYQSKVGNGPWQLGTVDPSGHPLRAHFYVGASPTSGTPSPPLSRPVSSLGVISPSVQDRYLVAARRILNRSKTPSGRGIVMCVTYLKPLGAKPLFDRTLDSRKRLVKPLSHLLSANVQTIEVDGRKYEYVWIHPNVPPTSPPMAGGMAFLPARGQSWFALVTFNVAGLDNDFRRSCTNGHHAEMQMTRFVKEQPELWRSQLGAIELRNYSRTPSAAGYSACNACLHDLAGFVVGLNRLPRPRPISMSVSWERLYDKNSRCGHPTDAANIARLVAVTGRKPQGPLPVGAQSLSATTVAQPSTPTGSRVIRRKKVVQW